MVKWVLICFVGMFAIFDKAKAGSLTASIGPEQVGNGGAYPLFVPPVDPYQWGFTWVSNSSIEGTLGLCPGFLLGYRFKAEGLYVSAGGGLIFDSNGTGVGPYSSFGYESGGGTIGWHFNASYTQALGFRKAGYLAPSSMRFGAIWEYK